MIVSRYVSKKWTHQETKKGHSEEVVQLLSQKSFYDQVVIRFLVSVFGQA